MKKKKTTKPALLLFHFYPFIKIIILFFLIHLQLANFNALTLTTFIVIVIVIAKLVHAALTETLTYISVSALIREFEN